MKHIFNQLSRKHRRNNNARNPTGSVQNLPSLGHSSSNLSVSSEPIPQVQEIQGNQSPGIGTQLAGEAQSSAIHHQEPNQVKYSGNQSHGTGTQPVGGAQSSAMHIAGSVLEKGLNTLKDFADLVPMAPGLGPALEVVCRCVEVYHVSNFSLSVGDHQTSC